MSQIVLTGIGDPAQNYRVEKDPELTVGPADVLVRLEAAPVNPVDFLFANGWYPVQPQLPSTIGSEGVGRVISAGPDADQALVDKRVIILPTYEQGVWADTAVVPARNVVAVPEGVDGLQLSMLAINPLTAYGILTKYVDLKPGDWIGQNLGNSAVARSVIALAKRAGFKTLSVVRRSAGVADVLAQGGDVALVEGPGLGSQIGSALGGAKLRLVLDGAAAGTPGELAASLEPGGTVVTYSSTTKESPTLPLGNLVFSELVHRGFWVVNWVRDTPRAEIERVVADLAALIADGTLSVPVDSTFPLDRYEEAIARATAPGRTGKVLFTFPQA